jgi:3-hydroxyisobutyrate dehydrogenase
MSERGPGLGPVGFIGLGRMGRPMCQRLVGAGWQVVGYDADAGAAESLATTSTGFVVASEPADVAAQARIVVLMLPNSDIVDAVVLGGLIDDLAPGSIVVDMSSSVPARTRALAARLVEHDVVLVDAPVSGGVAGARDGTLTVMVGGPSETVERLRPLLDLLGGRVERVGDVGAGHAAKALNNLMSAAHLWASSEALLAAERFGLDIPTALGVINSSSGRSGSTQAKWPNFILTQRYDSGFALSLMSKDVKIAVDLIESVGVPATVSQAVADAWSRAEEESRPGADHTEIVLWLEGASAAHTTPENANIAP